MAKGVGGAGRGGRAGGGALAQMMPAKNREDLGIAAGGGILSGKNIQVLAFNPKTGTLLAGAEAVDTHAHIVARYGKGQPYDAFVKAYLWPVRGGAGKQLYIDVDRVAGRDNAAKWDAAFRAARAFRSAGLPSSVTVRLDFGGRTAQYLELGEV